MREYIAQYRYWQEESQEWTSWMWIDYFTVRMTAEEWLDVCESQQPEDERIGNDSDTWQLRIMDYILGTELDDRLVVDGRIVR